MRRRARDAERRRKAALPPPELIPFLDAFAEILARQALAQIDELRRRASAAPPAVSPLGCADRLRSQNDAP